MENDIKEFKISVEEIILLRQLIPDDIYISIMQLNAQHIDCHKNIIKMTKMESEHLREQLTDHLARIGFKEDYSLTEQGRSIESLIDKFFRS